MSRSGYSDGCDGWDLIRWRGAVKQAIHGKRGQQFLREMLTALDALPEKRLISDLLEDGGEVCAIGSVGVKRGVDLKKLDPENPDGIAAAFGISAALVQEIEFINDDDFDYGRKTTPEQRFQAVRAWVVEQLAPPKRENYISDEFYQKALAKWQAKQPDSANGKP
jgi:hypothetical protein